MKTKFDQSHITVDANDIEALTTSLITLNRSISALKQAIEVLNKKTAPTAENRSVKQQEICLESDEHMALAPKRVIH